MSARKWKWLAMLTAAAGPVLVFQAACTVDPDIYLQAFLQIVTNVGIFSLENLANAIR